MEENKGDITLKNSMEPDSLICQFMELVDNFFREKTVFKTLGYNESPTDSKKVIRLSVFLAEKNYIYGEDNYAWARELGSYLEERFPEQSESHSSIVKPCPQCSQRPTQDF